MVQYVLRRVNIAGRIAFEPPADMAANASIKHELRKCRDKHNDYVLVTLQPPKKPRTTGEGSQNHHLNGHIMQICNETGASYSATKDEIKRIAVELMGYPYEIINGHIHPIGESESSTDECAKLIEAAHVLAADLSIILIE
ncbi:MAG: hypothetical protein J5631_07015 [Spirochaetaceae bacterium]|nr:hypothetical protein [Spirochaetaceae bacterium]